jgi:hypothetical protein
VSLRGNEVRAGAGAGDEDNKSGETGEDWSGLVVPYEKAGGRVCNVFTIVLDRGGRSMEER